MSKNKPFGKVQEERVKELVANADVHKETHHISFKVPESLSGEKGDQIKESVELVNGWGLAVEAATNEIAQTQFPDTKQESWDGRLEVFDGLTMSTSSHLRQVVGEDTLYGTADTFIDHPHSPEMVNWYADYQAVNVDRAKKLFS